MQHCSFQLNIAKSLRCDFGIFSNTQHWNWFYKFAQNPTHHIRIVQLCLNMNPILARKFKMDIFCYALIQLHEFITFKLHKILTSPSLCDLNMCVCLCTENFLFIVFTTHHTDKHLKCPNDRNVMVVLASFYITTLYHLSEAYRAIFTLFLIGIYVYQPAGLCVYVGCIGVCVWVLYRNIRTKDEIIYKALAHKIWSIGCKDVWWLGQRALVGM